MIIKHFYQQVTKNITNLIFDFSVSYIYNVSVWRCGRAG